MPKDTPKNIMIFKKKKSTHIVCFKILKRLIEMTPYYFEWLTKHSKHAENAGVCVLWNS